MDEATRQVSFEDEPLILVDDADLVLGYESKQRCHDGEGLLHRAFSVFLFNAAGELLLQQRSKDKRLWPLYWSNSCCSHPRRGEQVQAAAERRIVEELGVHAPLSFVFKFHYQARFLAAGAEHELCYVYCGRHSEPVVANANEVAAWRMLSVAALDQELASAPEQFTPWFKIEWRRLRLDYLPADT